MQFVINTLPTC